MKIRILFLITVSNIILISNAFSHKESLIIENIKKSPNLSVYIKAIKEKSQYNFSIKEGVLNVKSVSLVASARVIEDNNGSGWTYQMIETQENYDDVIQAYWGGYLEVFSTLKYVKATMFNLGLQSYCSTKSSYCSLLNNTLHENIKWMKKNVLKYRSTDPFWYQVEIILWYVQGLQDAYEGKHIKSSKELSVEAFKKIQLNVFGIYLLQISEDLGDMEVALGKRARVFSSDGDHCSALIKVLPGLKDIYTSHVTWTGFSSMLRVIKFYDTPFHRLAKKGSSVIPGRVISFSSLPGHSHSGDDFYTMSSKLVTIETTNSFSNKTLDDIIRKSLNSSIYEFMRVMIANRLANSGKEWVQHFSRYNSGTYNNQYMVVDYKKFQSGKSIKAGTLTIAEQMPGRVVSSDESNTLRSKGYWASYNVPYFPDVYKAMGFEKNGRQYPMFFNYSMCARARIFRRDQSKVKDLKSMMRLMRYNDYTHDPLSRCNCTPPYSPNLAISSRYDLFDPKGKYPLTFMSHSGRGATDMKLINSSMVTKGNFIAIMGPPYDQVPTFQWSKFDLSKSTAHAMQVDKFEFPPVITPFTMNGQNEPARPELKTKAKKHFIDSDRL